MTESPLISVVTICYNAESYIACCINSVLNQDLKDFEYIVIDGGSSDGTVDVIKQYQGRLAYWHSRPDSGLSHAFNLGLEQVHGQWVLFLNADDYFLDGGVLARMAPVLRSSEEKDVVYGFIQRVSREDSPVAVEPPYGGPFSWRGFLKKNTIPHPSAFTNAKYIQRVGIYDEHYKVAMDYEFYLRGGPSLRVLFYPELVTCMRDGGVSRAHRHAALDECLRALRLHHVCSTSFIFMYGVYLKTRLLVRDVLLKSRLISS